MDRRNVCDLLVGSTVVVEGVLSVAMECVFRVAISTVPHQDVPCI